jgi:ubiquinone biosynthesis protein COQ4
MTTTAAHRTVHSHPVPFFRGLAALCLFGKIVRQPESLDHIIEMADQLADPNVIAELVEVLGQDAQGQAAFASRPRLQGLDLAALEALPEGTLGHAYAAFLRDHELDPAALPDLAGQSDGEYLRAHLYETHDLWHVLTGFSTDVAGELGLQAFYMAQMPSPLAVLLLSAGLLNTVLYRMEDVDARMELIIAGWLMGRRASSLFGADWSEAWETPLTAVRSRYSLAAL